MSMHKTKIYQYTVIAFWHIGLFAVLHLDLSRTNGPKNIQNGIKIAVQCSG